MPVSPALQTPTSSVEDVRQFSSKVGYPIMVKAVDGGGGRGIRLIRNDENLTLSFERAVQESPSKQVFAEKASIDGFRHVEVQIIGDGRGNVTHLWERECSIQRRYQKIVELAPSVVPNRKLIAKVINDALTMARHVSLIKHIPSGRATYARIDSIFFAGNFRISCESDFERVLLLGSKPTATGRAHGHRIHLDDGHSQSPTTACSRR